MKPANLARAALIVALVAGLALTFANRDQFSAEALQAWLASAGWWAPVFFIAIYAAGTVLFLPGALYSLAGATLGGVLAYAWLGHAGRAALAGDANSIRNGMLALAVAAALMFLPRLVRRFKAGLMITPEMLRALQAESGVAVVDVRDAKDFTGETGHVPGALNLPLGELPARIEELAPWRKDGVVLICRTQVRSGEAARLLAKQGFSDLRVVRGGMLAWRESGYPIEGTAIAEGAPGDPRRGRPTAQ